MRMSLSRRESPFLSALPSPFSDRSSARADRAFAERDYRRRRRAVVGRGSVVGRRPTRRFHGAEIVRGDPIGDRDLGDR